MVYFGVFFVLSYYVRFPNFYSKILYFYDNFHSLSLYLHMPSPLSIHGWHAWVTQSRGGWDMRLGKKRNNFARVGMKIFWCTIDCVNPKPKTNPQSSYLYHRGIGRPAPRIMQKYYVAIAISIQLLTQPHMCKVGSSIFLP